MRRGFGLFLSFVVASLVSSVACVDDPTFQLVESDAGDASVGTGDAGGTSSGGTSSSGGTDTDAGPSDPRCSILECARAGGVCDRNECVLRCPGIGCSERLRCPNGGGACRIECRGKDACKYISCEGAASCSVLCEGESACSDQMTINSDSTTITCTGKDACKKAACSGNACAVTCREGNACKPPEVRCCAGTCTVNGAKGECRP